MMQTRPIRTRLLLHGILIAGVAMFSLPFVWMLGTSMMSDKELFREGLHVLPRRPVPRLQSPYLDSGQYTQPQRPTTMPKEVWQKKKTALLDVTTDLIAGEGIESLRGIDRADLSAEALKGVWHGLLQSVDPTKWPADDETVHLQIKRGITRANIDSAVDRAYRMLGVSYLDIRTKDARHHKLESDKHPATFWRALTDNVVLHTPDDKQDQYVLVQYDLSEIEQWSLEAMLDCDVPVESIKSFRLAMRQDETWHRLQIVFEYAGKRWETSKPTGVGGYQWQEIILREWDPATYNPYEPHPWLWIDKTAEGRRFDHGKQMRVQLTVTRSTNLQAWHAKASANYVASWRFAPFWRYAATSTALVILNIVLMVLSSSLAAYSFARLRWPGREFCFLLLLGTLMIPYQVTLIPGFVIMKWLGWYNTLKPMWIGAAFGNAFNIFLLRQFMKSIPQDLEDAARIDGCGFLRIWWHIMLPLVKPTLAAIAVFTFIGTWNDFMTPLIYLNDDRLYPLALGLFSLQTMIGSNHAMMMAGSIIMTMPVIAVFFLAQRYFVQGITLTGMKA